MNPGLEKKLERALSFVINQAKKNNPINHVNISLAGGDFNPGRPFQLYVGVEGTVAGFNGAEAVNGHFLAMYHPILMTSVLQAGTTATSLRACFLD